MSSVTLVSTSETQEEDLSSLHADLPDGCIRILIITGLEVVPRKYNPAIPDLAISCKQEVISLTDFPHLSPNNSNAGTSYAALSYVWGASLSDRYVLCDGRPRKVSANLYNALWHIVVDAETLPVRLWVDALCINQQDEVEKSHQVAMMGDIYRNASHVVIWLGTGAEQHGDLDEFWTWLENREKDMFIAAPAQSAIDAGLVFFQRCDWFRRSWTFQEICLAREAYIKRGHSIIHWRLLVQGLSELSKSLRADPSEKQYFYTQCKTELEKKMYDAINNLPNSMESAKHDSGSFSNLMLSSTGRIAKDPRDRIYSLLGMYTGSQRLVADYTLPIHVVNAQAAIWMAHELGNLEFLPILLTGLPWTYYSTDCNYSDSGPGTIIGRTSMDLRNNHLFSWIPDWMNCTESQMRASAGLLRVGSFRLNGIEDKLPKRDFRRFHETFSMQISLEDDILMASGVLLGHWMPWWMDNNTSMHQYAMSGWGSFNTFPPCISSQSCISSTDSKSVPSIYEPVFREAKDIYLDLLRHDQALCECKLLVKGFLKNGNDNYMRKELRKKFVEGEEGISNLQTVQMAWCCLLFGSLQPFVVEPIFDSDKDSFALSLVAKLSYEHPWTSHIYKVAQDPGSREGFNLGCFDSGGQKSKQSKSPEDALYALGMKVSWIPTTLKLFGQSMTAADRNLLEETWQYNTKKHYSGFLGGGENGKRKETRSRYKLPKV